MAVPPRLPQESGDGRLDHPVEPDADRQDAWPGRLGEHQAVRRIWPGRRHLHRPVLDRLGPDAKLVTIDTNPDFTHYLQAVDRRSAAGRGHRIGGRRREDPRRSGARLGRLRAFRPALLDASPGSRRRHCRSDGKGDPRRAARSWSISSARRCAISSSRISRRIKRGFEWINVPPATLFWAYKGEPEA